MTKPIAWLHGEIRTPPFSLEARVETGALLRRLQEGELLGMPLCRPMPSIGPGCYELRITDENTIHRVFYAVRSDAIVVLGVLTKKMTATPATTIRVCSDRLRRFEEE